MFKKRVDVALRTWSVGVVGLVVGLDGLRSLFQPLRFYELH